MNQGMYGFPAQYEDEADLIFMGEMRFNGPTQNRTTGGSFAQQLAVVTFFNIVKVYAMFWHTRVAAKCLVRRTQGSGGGAILETYWNFNSGVGTNPLFFDRPRIFYPGAYYFAMNMTSTTWNDYNGTWTGDDFKISSSYDGTAYSFAPPIKFLYEVGDFRGRNSE